MRGFRPVEFIKEVVSELQKAVWPSRDETIRLTWVVVVVAALVGFVLGFFDFSLSRTLTKYIILP
ncbi:preprotein translocase subunit SecE [SAR202 cluster bacterium AD-804-J14_MRT_500m]|nr:preprotein translocase subunit SecE [SAR202 cluster bacterium AD-804-J14_MRT_500m]